MRNRLRRYLERQRQQEILSFKTGEEIDGNQGNTLITGMKLLPSAYDVLADDILEYCTVPRTESKIMNRFRRNGDPLVRQAIRNLESKNLLRSLTLRREKGYHATSYRSS